MICEQARAGSMVSNPNASIRAAAGESTDGPSRPVTMKEIESVVRRRCNGREPPRETHSRSNAAPARPLASPGSAEAKWEMRGTLIVSGRAIRHKA